MPNSEIGLELLGRLIYVIGVLVNWNDLFPLHQVIQDRRVNHYALGRVETLLGEIGRQDVLEILQKTRAGK